MKKSATGPQCKPTRNQHGMHGNTIDLLTDHRYLHQWLYIRFNILSQVEFNSMHVRCQSTATIAEMLQSATAATDVGIYGLLASHSCYHSMLVPCWFTLWTSSRFLHPYILLISLEIFLFSCLCPFFFFHEFQILCSSNSARSFISLFPPLVWFAVADNFFLTCSSYYS